MDPSSGVESGRVISASSAPAIHSLDRDSTIARTRSTTSGRDARLVSPRLTGFVDLSHPDRGWQLWKQRVMGG